MQHESVHDETDTTRQNWVGTIMTNSDIPFNMEYPTPDMVDIDDIAQALSLICRYNGQVPTFYSVAEHSVRVFDWLIDQGFPQLALRGLLHDAAEAYVGDIVRPMKRMPKFAEVYNDIEQRVETAIGEKFGVGLWPIHPIVKEADMCIYDWEVANIRSGKKDGWNWQLAKAEFMNCFSTLYNDQLKEDYSYEDHRGNPMPEEDLVATSPRRILLDNAAELVDGDRNVQYGDPRADFQRTATYWNTHLTGVLDRKVHELVAAAPYDGPVTVNEIMSIISELIDAHDIAIMMDLLKTSRLAWSPDKEDTWTDKAGYTACGWHCIVADDNE